MEDKETEEDWLSVKSKQKNISQGQGPSSSGSGEEGLSGGGGEEECKSKKAKLAVPHIALTSSIKRAADSDPTWSECNEGKQSVRDTIVAVGKNGKLVIVVERESKVVEGKAVNNGEVWKVKWLYIKHNVEYWEGKKDASLNGKGNL